MLSVNNKQSGESVESVLKKKRKAAVGKNCRLGRFQAWNERVMMRVVSRWNRWRKCHSKNWVSSGFVRIGEISAWLTKGSRELSPWTRRSILEGTICYS